MSDTLVLDAADRLFADHATTAVVNAAEAGTWPDELWQATEAAGFPDALAEFGGLADAVAILRAAGRHAVPLPLPETMLARFALRAAGLTVPHGPLTLAPVERDDVVSLRRDGSGWRLSGTLRRLPWASEAARLVVVADGAVARVAPAPSEIRRGKN